MASRPLDLALNLLASSARGWRGTGADIKAKTPEKTLQLYEFENCPYCRLVREVLTELHLDAEIYPCPKGGTRFRPVVTEKTGKEQFPLLIDPNTGVALLESADIVEYLISHYGSGSEGGLKAPRALQVASSGLASAWRGSRGTHATPSRLPEKMLELWSFESSPYSRPVRELLCEMELPYLLHNLGKEQRADWGPPNLRPTLKPYAPVPNGKRAAFLADKGQMQVPYLFDPNTDTGLFESAEIMAYLKGTYGG